MSGARCAVAVVVCAGCLWVLGGCAAVKVTRADGTEQYSIHPFGIGAPGQGSPGTQVADRQADGLQHISALSFGVSRNARGDFDLGYRKEDIVLAPTSCQAVFVINTPQQAETAQTLARDVKGQCAVRR